MGILVNCRGQISVLNSLVEEAPGRTTPISAVSQNAFSLRRLAKWKCLISTCHYQPRTVLPSPVALIYLAFPRLCLNQSTPFAQPPSTPLLFFIFMSFSLSFSLRQSRHAKSSCSEQRCLLMKTQGKCAGNCFHFVKRRGRSFLLCSARPGTAVCSIQ